MARHEVLECFLSFFNQTKRIPSLINVLIQNKFVRFNLFQNGCKLLDDAQKFRIADVFKSARGGRPLLVILFGGESKLNDITQ